MTAAERRRAYRNERQRAYKKNSMVSRSYCDCGELATIVLCNAKICQRCYDADRRRPAETKEEFSEESIPQAVREVYDACVRWEKRKGFYDPKGFKRLSFGGLHALLAKL